jgi:hypothetical protein
MYLISIVSEEMSFEENESLTYIMLDGSVSSCSEISSRNS